MNIIYHFSLISVMIVLTFWVIDTNDRMIITQKMIKANNEMMVHIHDYIIYDLKPRSIIMDKILSYQLPTAIVKAFEISHTDLRETLEGVVVDLAKLTEVYRALLGFDQN
ncbi:transmembrane protein 1 [Bat paramyxovirus]|uniref:Transmembrane protein 1 n=1 Tax=bat paramyxovirus 16797 TaxID=3070194 RepID=A0AA48FTV2_9MONO|nr:transmembrane protein 1 [Bat paramyxovirus]AYM47537.1 transmembrane protein 1 [bat paramyxovirus 16797]